MKIKVRTGANLRNILKSTVTIPQAFTELVKNCVQNDATFCKITLLEDKAIIEDDGIGFSHLEDQDGLNSFDKYFVYGNSYDQLGGSGVRLGQMGIGGKVANDKLSHSTNADWQIETKNLLEKSFLIKYQPNLSASDFLEDYSPTITEIENSSIKSRSGSIITINNLSEEILADGWNETSIKFELQRFFSLLLQELARDQNPFSLFFQGEELNYDFELPGHRVSFSENFSYELLNSRQEKITKNVDVNFNLSYVESNQLLSDFHHKSIDIVSKVKVCALTSDCLPTLEETKIMSEDLGHKTFDYGVALKHFNRLIGFISCTNLSEDFDYSGNNAKDISHHSLRSDHPITKPFYNCVGNALMKWIIAYDLTSNSYDSDSVSGLAAKLSELVLDILPPELLDFSDFDFGIEDEELIFESIDKLSNLASNAIDSALKTQKDMYEAIGEHNDSKNTKKNTTKWQDNISKLSKTKKSIPFEIIAFEQHELHLLSKLDPYSKFRILINKSNSKYKMFYEYHSPILMSLHITEILIREILFYKNPPNLHEELDRAISLFYEHSFPKIKNELL